MMCVGNDNDVREVALGANGAFDGMKKGAVFVDHTTASAEIARELYAEAKKRGFDFVDAPVSGGQAGAENGALTVMCGGDAGRIERAEKVIAAYARMCKLLGVPARASSPRWSTRSASRAWCRVSPKASTSPRKPASTSKALIATISKGAAQSWQMENRYKTMNAGKFDFGFAVDWMRKDLGICIAEARKKRREPAGRRAGRPVLRRSAEDGRQPLGYVEPDRPARSLIVLLLFASGNARAADCRA